MPNILPTNYYAPEPLAVIRQQLPVGFELLALDRPGKAAIIERIAQADYLLVGGRVPIDHEVINSAVRLKMIQRTGVGLDSLDLPLLKQRGIPVYVNAGVNSRSVAEHTVMLILATLRRLTEVDASVKSGEWKKHELGIQCRGLDGKTVGLVGLGAIGKTVAEMLRPFRVRLLYTKPSRLADHEEQALDLTYVGLEELLSQSDIVSLHCPLDSETRGMLGQRQFQQMKPGSVLINTARGPLVDEAALISALESRQLSGAGLDVFATEPIPEGNRLVSSSNLIATPHLSGLMRETFAAMMREALDNIEQYEIGNIEALSTKLLKNQ